jgi:hypothetical protein
MLEGMQADLGDQESHAGNTAVPAAVLTVAAAAAAAHAAAVSLKIRPKNISRHGRQNVYDGSGQRHFFNIGKVRGHVKCA